MLCFLSFIFILAVVSQLENGLINNSQFWFFSTYGLLMLYHTSKPYWTENIEKQEDKNKKKRTNSNHHNRN